MFSDGVSIGNKQKKEIRPDCYQIAEQPNKTD